MSGPREIYTHSHHPVVVAAHAARIADEAAAFVVPRLRPGMRILDFGCGPGSISQGLAEYITPGGSVTGIDTSPDVIATARANRSNSAVTFLAASVYELPFPDASFDVVYGHQVLQHLAEPVTALRELRRVLRPCGLVAVRDADYGTMTHYPQTAAIDRWLDIYHAVARDNGGEPDAGRALASWVLAAGFAGVATTTSTWSYTTPEERAAWSALWADRILIPRFADRAAALNAADRDELAAIAAGWREWAQQPDGFFAFIHGEVVATNPG